MYIDLIYQYFFWPFKILRHHLTQELAPHFNAQASKGQ